MKRTFQNIIWQSKEVKAVSEALNAYESTYEKLNIKKGERDIYVNQLRQEKRRARTLGI